MDWRQAEVELDSPVLGRTTLPRMFEASAERNRRRTAQRYKGGVYDRSLVAADVLPAAPAGEFAGVSYVEMRRIVRRLAAGLRELGLTAGDRVGAFAHTRMEWAQVDFATLAAGGVVTTVYTSSSERQVEYLLGDAGATGVVVENADLLDRVLAVEDALDLSFIVVMDEFDRGAVDAEATLLTLGELHERGAAAFDEAAYESWLDGRDLGDLASLVYTSGTTGKPKGVRLSHRNFRANVDQCYRRFGARPDESGGDAPTVGPHSTTLSFLPLAHVFERLAGHFMMFAAGATVAYAESPDTLREDFGLVRPTTGTSVPRVYEKLYAAIREEAADSSVGERLFEWATDVGRRHREADDPGLGLELRRRIADRLVFSRVRDALGGRIEFFISGGGSLSPGLCALYHAMGLPVLEGYGLTETAPVVAVNPPEAPRIGTIGVPVVDERVAVDESVAGAGDGEERGSSVDGIVTYAEATGRRSPRTADTGPREASAGSAPDAGGAAADGGANTGGADGSGGDAPAAVGELIVRGPNVTDGYWNRPEETAAAFLDGGPATAGDAESPEDATGRWFRTGDVVELRADGYLAFRERAKQLLVLSTGKNVAPGPIEGAFARSRLVEQCMALGDGRKFVSALIVPSVESVRARADREGVDLPEDRRGLCRDDRVREWIQAEVDAVNEGFEDHERIKRFRLVPEEFSEENGLLTPTMKKRRRHIFDRFADEIELLYDATESDP